MGIGSWRVEIALRRVARVGSPHAHYTDRPTGRRHGAVNAAANATACTVHPRPRN
jgi:hypothetical protein